MCCVDMKRYKVVFGFSKSTNLTVGFSHIKGNDFTHINTWEQLAGVGNIWYAILLLDIDNGQGKFLDQSDNMTALKWMLTSKYYDSKEHVLSILCETISSKLAKILLSHDDSIYTQHTPGV